MLVRYPISEDIIIMMYAKEIINVDGMVVSLHSV